MNRNMVWEETGPPPRSSQQEGAFAHESSASAGCSGKGVGLGPFRKDKLPCTFQEKGNRCQEPSEAGARRDKREERLAHYKAVPYSMLLPCCVAAAFVALYRLEVLDRAFARQSATRAA